MLNTTLLCYALPQASLLCLQRKETFAMNWHCTVWDSPWSFCLLLLSKTLCPGPNAPELLFCLVCNGMNIWSLIHIYISMQATSGCVSCSLKVTPHATHFITHQIKLSRIISLLEKKAHEGTRASCLLPTQCLTLCSVFMVWNHLRCYWKQVLVPPVTSPLHKAGAQHTSAEQNWLFLLQSGKGKTQATCPMRRAAFPVIPNSIEESFKDKLPSKTRRQKKNGR